MGGSVVSVSLINSCRSNCLPLCLATVSASDDTTVRRCFGFFLVVGVVQCLSDFFFILSYLSGVSAMFRLGRSWLPVSLRLLFLLRQYPDLS